MLHLFRKPLLLTLLLIFLFPIVLQAKPQAKPQAKKSDPKQDFGYRFADNLKQTDDSIERLDQWFTDAKFGAFIHFGVYSMLEGEYKGRGAKRRYSEWIMVAAGIPAKEYREIAATFNPAEFDAKEWAKTFRESGIRYVVITAKHHDGFAMYDSDVDDFNIADHTAFKRDLIKELCDACHAEGLKFGVYYSHAQDWSQPDAPHMSRRTKAKKFHPDLPVRFKPDMDRYLREKSLPQVEELVKKYPLDLIWFDTPINITEARAKLFSDMVRKHRPNCLINSRIIQKGKAVIKPELLYLYDYVSIGDKEVPTKPLPLYVESPDSVSSSFGYKTKGAHHYHSTEEMIHRFVHIVCAGGNALINNGPMGNGKLDPKAVELYQAIGAWLKVNGQAIYSSRRSPIVTKPDGTDFSISKDRKSLYLFVLKWEPGDLKIEGVPVKVTAAVFLDGGDTIPFKQVENSVSLTLPAQGKDPNATVVKLSLEKPWNE